MNQYFLQSGDMFLLELRFEDETLELHELVVTKEPIHVLIADPEYSEQRPFIVRFESLSQGIKQRGNRVQDGTLCTKDHLNEIHIGLGRAEDTHFNLSKLLEVRSHL